MRKSYNIYVEGRTGGTLGSLAGGVGGAALGSALGGPAGMYGGAIAGGLAGGVLGDKMTGPDEGMEKSKMKKGMKKGGKKKKKMKEHTTFEEYAKLRDSQLNEVGTSTANVAQFRRMTIPATVRREWPDSTDDFFKRKKNSSTGCPCVDRE